MITQDEIIEQAVFFKFLLWSGFHEEAAMIVEDLWLNYPFAVQISSYKFKIELLNTQQMQPYR